MGINVGVDSERHSFNNNNGGSKTAQSAEAFFFLKVDSKGSDLKCVCIIMVGLGGGNV